MFELKIETENDAFVGRNGPLEIARILRVAADRIEDLPNVRVIDMKLRDFNGNTVGKAEYTDGD